MNFSKGFLSSGAASVLVALAIGAQPPRVNPPGTS